MAENTKPQNDGTPFAVPEGLAMLGGDAEVGLCADGVCLIPGAQKR